MLTKRSFDLAGKLGGLAAKGKQALNKYKPSYENMFGLAGGQYGGQFGKKVGKPFGFGDEGQQAGKYLGRQAGRFAGRTYSGMSPQMKGQVRGAWPAIQQGMGALQNFKMPQGLPNSPTFTGADVGFGPGYDPRNIGQ